MMGQAEKLNITNLEIDTSLLEDEMLLSEAANMEKESEKPTIKMLAPDAGSSSMKQMLLPSLDSSKQAISLEVQVTQLKERMKDLQNEVCAPLCGIS